MTLEERVESLEKRLNRARYVNRLLVVLGIGAVAVIGVFASGTLTAQNRVQDEVRARRFVVEDENGQEKVVLEGESINFYSGVSEGASLNFYSETGDTLVTLFASKVISMLHFYNGTNEDRLQMGTFLDWPYISLSDDENNIRISLRINRYNEPEFILYDENGERRTTMIVDQKGPNINLIDENGTTRSRIGVSRTVSQDERTTTYPESTIQLFNTDGYVRWEAP